jgi:hypothetical protein
LLTAQGELRLQPQFGASAPLTSPRVPPPARKLQAAGLIWRRTRRKTPGIQLQHAVRKRSAGRLMIRPQGMSVWFR